MQNLPSKLYSVQTVQQIEQLCIHQLGIPGYTLMRRAGQAVIDLIQKEFSTDKSLLILCGAGNNAGDGYVIARLAKQSGYSVKLITVVDTKKLKGDALLASKHWQECGEIAFLDNQKIESSDILAYLSQADVVVDALLGTGLTRELNGVWKTVVDGLNRSRKMHPNQTVISVDVPSGLKADTGVIAGVAVQADYTITYIGLKLGLFTGSGRACSGQILFDDLALPDEALLKYPADATLLNASQTPTFPPRLADAHKGLFGHVLIVGGNVSMAGAAILAAKSALRSGAGLVTVFTHASNVSTVTVACPEAMVVCSDNTLDGVSIPQALLSRVTHIAIGPGLGVNDWAERCLAQCLLTGKPLVIDADALNLLAAKDLKLSSHCVLTPHPGEAARLLDVKTSCIAENRFEAIKNIHQKYAVNDSLVVLLKGSGSLVFDGTDISVCPSGNPAMATAGMGDVLTGVVIACMAQGLSLVQSAKKAVSAHGLAGDKAARGITRGLMASDVIECLPASMNS